MSARSLGAAAALVALCLGLASSGPASPAPTPQQRFQTALYLKDVEPGELALAYSRLRAAGATVIRQDLNWRTVVPDERPEGFHAADPNDPAYDWSRPDNVVRLAASNGLQVLFCIRRAPAWAQRGPGPDEGDLEVDLGELSQFATAVALRYSGDTGDLPRVRYWQVWNEPNVSLELEPQYVDGQLVAADRYRGMVNAVADAVHSVHDDNLVVAGGQSPFELSAPNLTISPPFRFMRELLCMSGGQTPQPTCDAQVKFDIWAHNPYTRGGPTHQASLPDDASLGDLPEMTALLRAAVEAKHVLSSRAVDFWATEFSWDSRPPDPKGLPLALHARWIAESFYRMWENGVTLLTWLQLHDSPFPKNPVQAGLYFRGKDGLVRNDRPKPALRAFRFPFVALRRGSKVFVWGRTPGGKPGAVVVQQRLGSRWRPRGTLRTSSVGIFTASIPLALRRDRPSTRRTLAKGELRARLVSGTDTTVPFSLTPPPDRDLNPFGS